MFKLGFIATLSLSLGIVCQQTAFAQRNYDPNLNHFYMGRQQVQVIDDSPIVSPGSSGAATSGGRMNGAMPNRPLPLPSAGWQTYTPAQPPGFTTGLPKVNNGVPQKPGPQGPAGQKGKAGTLAAGKGKTKGKPSQVAASPNGVSAYKPYATYKPAPSGASATTGMNNQQSTTNVRGSILHWARGPHRTN
jgi:hypothetical protein